MKALLAHWRQIEARLDALSLRERVLIFLALACISSMLVILGLIEPGFKRHTQMQAEIVRLNEEMRQLQSQIEARSGQADQATGQDGNIPLNARLIDAQDLAAVLRGLVEQAPGVKLLDLAALPPAPLAPEQAAGRLADDTQTTPEEARPAQGQAQLYRHDLRLRLSGSYAGLTAYVARLERLPWLLLWSGIELDGERHPEIVMTLELASFSTRGRWP